MRVSVLYFDGCPNWELARNRAGRALAAVGEPADVAVQRVATIEEAELVRFAGSPTILIDGEDRFAGAGDVAMACRLYGSDHAPSVEELVEALRR